MTCKEENLTLIKLQLQYNTIVLDRCNNWNELLFKEALMIKRHCPTLNTGLRASNKLQLF